MQGALSGFFTIGTIVAAGALLAHFRVLGDLHRALLNRLAFLVASPALLFSLVSRADLAHLFSHTLVVSVLAIAIAAAGYLIGARALFGRPNARTIVGTLCASYTNAGNLGLPIAAAIMGDMTWMAPIMLVQVGFLQPVALALLDTRAARHAGEPMPWYSYLTLPLRNPITTAVLLAMAVNLSGLGVPDLVMAPIELVGAIAVPAMLLAFGVSLRLDPLPRPGRQFNEVVLIQVVKVLLMPCAAWALGMAFGLSGHELLAVTVIAALPAAQNIFVIASRYEVGELLARDSIFISTMLSVPSITLIAALLG
ncbi:AEC family transporter [Micropruina sonneratiae]|uniref:AEC family transporter n=1 Tax=Micropruina sonneratiae TaxID=2986940 RepID=UPI0022265C5F|nr:AEC family transporter [Micropruina sp. KQZ13P-5]MCW3157860.1 AEC family transporter [Micropruina sp. KQZ13P-5]